MDQPPGHGEPDDSVEWALRERTKEITALLEVSRLAHAAQSEDELLTSVLPAIPPGWQYPDTTAARLEIGTTSAQTPNYRATPRSLTEPLLHEGLVLGALTVASTSVSQASDDPFLPEEHLLLRGLAEQITAALIRIRSQRELAYWTDHDRQTGLLNRSAWSLAVARRTAEEPERPYAYVLCKASSLADINSTYGFSVGNRIVTELGRRIKEHFGEMSSRDGARFTFLRDDLPVESLRTYIQSEVMPVLNQPFQLAETAGLPMFLSSTVTAVHYPGHSRPPRESPRSRPPRSGVGRKAPWASSSRTHRATASNAPLSTCCPCFGQPPSEMSSGCTTNRRWTPQGTCRASRRCCGGKVGD